MWYNKDMLIVGFLSWWYGEGWKGFFQEFGQSLKGLADFFSVFTLLKTLFSPYRQISANGGFVDKLISRVVGAFARLILIIVGVIVMILDLVFGTILMIIWPTMPILPVVCIALTILGVK